MSKQNQQVPAVVLVIQLPIPQTLLEDADISPEGVAHLAAPVLGQAIEDQVKLYRLQNGI